MTKLHHTCFYPTFNFFKFFLILAMSDKCYFFLLFSLMYFRNWSVLFYSTVGHSLSPTHSLPFHLKGSAFVCSHAYIISVKIRLDLLPNLLRIQRLSASPGKASKVILSPGTDPSGGAKISTFSGELAHITIAWDTTPLIFAGFRLQSKTTIRFCICVKYTLMIKDVQRFRIILSRIH